MTNPSKLLEQGRKSELWNKYCGYTNLSITEFMAIQEQLLFEQIRLLGTSKIGKTILGTSPPTNIHEFQQNVPLTTYKDYKEYLTYQNEDVLPTKPYKWACSASHSPDQDPKWVPVTKQFYDRLADSVISAMIMSSSSGPGDIQLKPKDKLILSTAPPPHISGYFTQSTNEKLDLQFLPPLAEGDKMEYRERIATGFRHAMREGIDYFYGNASILASMGNQFEENSNQNPKLSLQHLNPIVLWRLIKAVFKTNNNNHKLLPKDIWKPKGIISNGSDIEIFKDKIEYYWGRKPLEGYSCAEGGTICMQSWNFKGMTFFPDSCFLEFIPIKDVLIIENSEDQALSTTLFDQLDLGIYELVITNFQGGVFTRYRTGDMFEVISLDDTEINCQLPQVRFYSNKAELIVVDDFIVLSEKEIWKTIEDSKIEYREWVARKEIINNKQVIHLYIEMKPMAITTEREINKLLDKQFAILIPEYQHDRDKLDYDPIKVSLLPAGSFSAYMHAQQRSGVCITNKKLPHIQPSDEMMESLTSIKIRF